MTRRARYLDAQGMKDDHRSGRMRGDLRLLCLVVGTTPRRLDEWNRVGWRPWAGLTAVGIVAGTVPVLGLGVVITLVVLAAIGTAVVPFVLIANGIEMRRKEGGSLSNVLSGLLGVGLLVLMVWCVKGLFSPFEPWAVVGISLTMVLGWLSFGFLGYLASVLAVHRAKPLPGEHQIIVLGSALVHGKVPRLLANRLDRSIDQWRTDDAAGFHSVIIPSGGKGALQD